MGLNYNPKDATKCWPANDYQATLIDVKESESQAGNPMEVWAFKVYSPGGKETTIKDYVTVPACVFKIRMLADALNKREEFDAGQFHADEHVGKNVMLELKVEESAQYGDQNKIGKIKPVPKTQPAPGNLKEHVRRQPPPTNPISETPIAELDDCPF